MKLCVSNIAWKADSDEMAYRCLEKCNIQYLELAPTRWWSDLSRVSRREIDFRMGQMKKSNLSAVAFQAVLFGKADYSIFNPETRSDCVEYLKCVVDLAGEMGLQSIVFGSPKNRLKGSRTFVQAIADSRSVLRELGDYSASRAVKICFEPNPTIYGCDFGTDTSEVAAIVESVDSPGLWINLDAGALTINQESPSQKVEAIAHRIGHFHISEPSLSSFENPLGRHSEIAAALSENGYGGFASIEMRVQENELESVIQSIHFARACYGC